MREKYQNLLKKIKVLAESGVSGEKENAQSLLDKMMAKHGISIEELEGEKVDFHEFNVTEADSEKYLIFWQVASTILGTDFDEFSNPQNKRRALKITNSEFIEIESKFEFYWMKYQEERKVFRAAFIYKNNLLPKNPRSVEASEMTKEEVAKTRRIVEMMGSIERAEYRKQLQGEPLEHQKV